MCEREEQIRGMLQDMKKNEQLATIVRTMMKMHGKRQVFNNIYETGTRTVKCYGEYGGDKSLENHINNVLRCFGSQYEIKRTKGVSGYGAPGFIVKFYC